MTEEIAEYEDGSDFDPAELTVDLYERVIDRLMDSAELMDQFGEDETSVMLWTLAVDLAVKHLPETNRLRILLTLPEDATIADVTLALARG